MRSAALLAAGLRCLRVVLEDGPKVHWFQSMAVRTFGFLAVVFLTAFIVRTVRSPGSAVYCDPMMLPVWDVSAIALGLC